MEPNACTLAGHACYGEDMSFWCMYGSVVSAQLGKVYQQISLTNLLHQDLVDMNIQVVFHAG